ncbi:MAG: RNA polymerase sporulation sigma factor SigK [Clostridia bacterium]|nr:RNA polymerase sporulation sigma factor SigK [Clostridia bacterium]
MWSMVMQVLSNMLFMVLSVVNTGSFPKPLSAAREREALEAMARGDAEARQTLIRHNLRLVSHIIKKHYSGARDQEDLVSIGTIGLIKAVDTFNADKGRLATYASRCIENEIRMHFRAAKKAEREVSLSEPIETDGEGHPLTLMDVLAQEDTMPQDLEMRMNLQVLRQYVEECLCPREREIITLRYGLEGEPLTQWQVAERLGISRSYVSRLETRALGLLRRRYERPQSPH